MKLKGKELKQNKSKKMLDANNHTKFFLLVKGIALKKKYVWYFVKLAVNRSNIKRIKIIMIVPLDL